MSRELFCGLRSEPLCILLFSDGPWREQNCLCFYKCAYIPLGSVLGACEWILRMWIQLPKSGFNGTEIPLAKYIWVGLLSGFFLSFSEATRVLFGSRGDAMGGKAWRLYRKPWFLARCGISYSCGHQIWTSDLEFASCLQIRHAGILAVCWDSGDSSSVLHVTASVSSL